MDYEVILAEKDAIIAAQNVRFEKHEAETSIRIQQLEHELAQLKKMIFGSKRERFLAEANSNQLSLFSTDDIATTDSAVDTQHIEYDRQTPKKHPGRTELPGHLPVEEVIIEPEEDTTGMKRIGEEITETLEYTRASLIKKITIRPKYAKPDGEGVVIGKLPSRPIPKAIAEASLLSHIIISKFIDHLPFYRQIQRFKRDYQWEVSDSTINEWFVAVCTLLHPLYEVLKQKVLSSGYIQADESPIKVLDQDHEKGIHTGFQWVYYAPALKLVCFQYRKGRGRNGPREMLATYRGILQTDGWHAYDPYADHPDIFLIGCLAHARRYFVKAQPNRKKECDEVLGLFQLIYAEERKLKEYHRSEWKTHRAMHLHPLFDQLQSWVEVQKQKPIEPESAFGKAMTYITNQWPKLIGLLDHDGVEIDNNLIENKIRPLALGRKNYLFAGSHDAAQRISMMYSFFGTCAANDINPYEWLKSTLERIPDMKLSELDQLLPGSRV